MALTVKSIDEETTALADVYDGLIAPKKLWRNHNNKLYLALRAYAAGKVGLNDAALALHSRFDPRSCDRTDLRSVAKLVGTDFKQGAGSLLHITIVNSSTREARILPAGIYNYQSASGMVFHFELANDYAFDPEETRRAVAISREKGSFPVSQNADIRPFRSDGGSIDRYFLFSCEDNAGYLGYADEDDFAFRLRILRDADRQDHLKELELRIRNLPTILECNLVFNPGTAAVAYDGLTLAPLELLLIITGSPTDEIARLVAEEVPYSTHQVDPAMAVYYENDLYVDGKYPVYYMFHSTAEFTLAITYQYDAQKLKASQVEAAIHDALGRFKSAGQRVDVITEGAVLDALAAVQLPNVMILNVDILQDGSPVDYLTIPKTRLPRLTGIRFTAITEEAAV
jgi:hypothetical protein